MGKWHKVLGAGALGAMLATVPAAAASADSAPQGADHVVFVQTNDPAGNTILAYHRSDDGTLRAAGQYATGGLGGTAASAPVDALASQGSLLSDPEHGLLFAVNAGSDSITVFGVTGDHLARRQVISSAGQFPVSVTVHGDLLYVLDAGGDGSVSGFRIVGGKLWPLADSTRSLELDNTDPPLFISAPAQVGFDGTGDHLVVTTKNHNQIDVFSVRSGGTLSAGPVVSPSANPVPFAFRFDGRGHLLVTEAGTGTVTSYRIKADGTLATLSTSAANGQAALCWITTARGYYFGANAGSATLSSYRADAGGHVVLAAAVATTTSGGPIDMAASAGGRFLYVQNAAAGTVQGFRVGSDGTLTLVSTVTGLPAFSGHGMEGIVAA